MVAFLLFLVGTLAAVAVLRIRTDKGTLEIETVDDQVQVIVEKGGERVRIHDLKTGKQLELRSGKYQLKLGKGGEGLELDLKEVNLERAGKVIARIRKLPEPAVEVFVPSKEGPPGELRRFRGHVFQVNSVVVAPDGRVAVSAGQDGVIRIWDVASGKELRRCVGLTEHVMALALSPDGRTILSGGGGQYRDGHWLQGSDFDLRLWDLSTAKEIRRYEGHTGKVTSVAFSPDGKRAVSGSWDGTLRLWEVETGKELRVVDASCAAGSRPWLSRRRVARRSRAGSDRLIHLWDLATGKEVRTFAGHSERILSIAVSPDGRSVLSGSLDKTVRLWELASGKEVRRFEDLPTGVLSVAFSPDGQRALSGSGSILRDSEGAYSPAGFDSVLRVWDVASGREIACLEGQTHALTSVTFAPDGQHAFSAAGDHSVHLWRLPDKSAGPRPPPKEPAGAAGRPFMAGRALPATGPGWLA